MSRKSKNNKRSSQGKFTTNPKQYDQFTNNMKYDHILNEHLNLLYIINIKSLKTVATFNYTELYNYIINQ